MRRPAVILAASVLLLVIVAAVVLLHGWDDDDAEPLGLVGDAAGGLGALWAAMTNLALTFGRDREANKRAIAAAIEKYRGPIPFGALMAIAEHESGFKAGAVNPDDSAGVGNARGPWQIMDAYQQDYGVTPSSVFEVDASTKGAVAARMKSHQVIVEMAPAVLANLRDYTYLLYLGHFAGNGSVAQRKGLRWKIQQALDRGLPVTADTVGGYGHEAGLKATATRALYWEDQRAALLATTADTAEAEG